MLDISKNWTEKSRHLPVGDMVICFEQYLPREKWPLGLIEEVYQGPDGYVRVAKVHGNNLYTPSATKLCLLELNSRF